MNKEQEELVGEVYDKYTKKYVGYDDVPSKELINTPSTVSSYENQQNEQINKEF